jgi:Domain of unknown function (DUF4260)
MPQVDDLSRSLVAFDQDATLIVVVEMSEAEGLALLAAATVAYALQGFGWGWFALFFLAPDLTFAAYVFGPRWGAAAYNAAHSTIGPLALGAAALDLGSAPLEMAALIGLAHVGFDRMLGYGLKYVTAFGDTHLGRKGR